MPKRVADNARRDRQLLLRVTGEQLEILESAGHLRGCTPNAYVHDLVTSHIQTLRTDTFIQRDIDNRRAFAESEAMVTPIGTGRETRKSNRMTSEDAGSA